MGECAFAQGPGHLGHFLPGGFRCVSVSAVLAPGGGAACVVGHHTRWMLVLTAEVQRCKGRSALLRLRAGGLPGVLGAQLGPRNCFGQDWSGGFQEALDADCASRCVRNLTAGALSAWPLESLSSFGSTLIRYNQGIDARQTGCGIVHYFGKLGGQPRTCYCGGPKKD